MRDKATIEANRKQAEANGLVRTHFSNGSEFMAFEEDCFRCRHFVDEPRAGEKSCKWGIVDQFYRTMCDPIWGYGTTYVDPEFVKVENFCVTCLKFMDRDSGDDSRDPPKPDVPGQMFFGDMDIPVERVPNNQRIESEATND